MCLNETKQVFFTSKGGTHVPMFIVNKKASSSTARKRSVAIRVEYSDRSRVVTIRFTGKVDRNGISGIAKIGDVGEP